MKIAVIGYSGSGKSTLAAKLGKKYGIDVLYIDTIQFLPHWVERSGEEKKVLMVQFLDAHDEWVIDGNYTKLSFDRRMEEADKIIFLAFNRFSCVSRALKRYFRYKGKTRESMAQGCDEKIDAEFLWWVFYKGRTKERKKVYFDAIKKYMEKSVIIKNQRQLNRFEKEMKL
jgi:adenylate kinase family enzyme